MTIDFEAKQLHMSTPGRVALKRLNHAVGIAFFVHTEQDLLAMVGRLRVPNPTTIDEIRL